MRAGDALRVMVVDDEPLAREALIVLLRRIDDVRVTGTYGDGQRALDAVREDPPDALLVDVQMPVMDGFALVRALGPPPPLVIFVTAFDHYAVRAFESLALDYLLKPCSEEALRRALRRARRRIEADELADVGRRLVRLAAETQPAYLQRFTARKRNRTVLVQVDEIAWIEADDYCVRVHLVDGASHTLRRSLKWFGEQLDPAQFVRVHRSALVNLAHLREIRHPVGDDSVAVLASGAEVPLSRSGREALDAVLPST
ncbi:MAG: LytTR family DNA-binding domain-containing protein [Acidobacteriota bacterium]